MGAAMPAVLVELGFLSNPEEERRLQDPAYRAELTDALVRAVGAYKAEVEHTQGTAVPEAADATPPAPEATPDAAPAGAGGARR
jgi:N-acetylmuramoyl-L-alanine amidase